MDLPSSNPTGKRRMLLWCQHCSPIIWSTSCRNRRNDLCHPKRNEHRKERDDNPSHRHNPGSSSIKSITEQRCDTGDNRLFSWLESCEIAGREGGECGEGHTIIEKEM